MENYQLKLLQSGQYVKVVDGEVLGEATPGEVRCYLLQNKFPLSISSKDAEDQLLEASCLILFVAVILAGLALTSVVLLEIAAAFS